VLLVSACKENQFYILMPHVGHPTTPRGDMSACHWLSTKNAWKAPQAASQAPPNHSAPPQAMSGQGFPQQQFATRQPSSVEIQVGYEWI
jgi:hypothetical protein